MSGDDHFIKPDNDVETDGLLPCPFCGGEAKRHDIEAREDVDNAGASYIECAGCGACTQLHFDRKENLLDSWNRRKLTETIHSSRIKLLEAGEVLWQENDRALREEIKKHMTNVRHWREECGKLHAKLATRTDILNEISAQDRINFPPHGGAISRLITRGFRDYDPTTQPYDEPFRHVDRPSEYQRGLADGVKLAAEAANGVEPPLLVGMSDRYVSIYCAARRDASDLIKAIPAMPCEYCGDGKRTGLPGNACENCMNTGLAHPEFAK